MEELKLEQVGGGGDCRVGGTSPHSRTPSSVVRAREAGRASTCGGSIVRPWGWWMERERSCNGGTPPPPTPFTPTGPSRPRLTHMAMSLASPGVRASSGPTSFTVKKWSWSWAQESAMWGSWYTSYRWGKWGSAERAEKMVPEEWEGKDGEWTGCRKQGVGSRTLGRVHRERLPGYLTLLCTKRVILSGG